MRAIPFLFAVVALAGLSFAPNFGMGMGPGLDCSLGPGSPVLVNAAGTWDMVGPILPNYDPAGCVQVTASDVVIDCHGGAIAGTYMPSDIGIYIAPGVDNVTIQNCIIQNFGQMATRYDVGNVYIDGATNVRIDGSTLMYNIPAFGDHIAYNAFTPTSGLEVINTGLFTYGGGPIVSGIGGRDPVGIPLPAPVSDVEIDNSPFIMNTGYGAWIQGDDVTITDSWFNYNLLDGVYIIGDDDYIEGNDFSWNYGGSGLRIDDADGSQVIDNTFYWNTGDGLYLDTATDVYVYDNSFAYNYGGYGIWAEDVTDSTFELNNINWNGDGIGVDTDALTWNSNVDILDNDISGNMNYGAELYDMSGLEFSGNDVQYNYGGAGLYMENVDPSVIDDNDFIDQWGGYGVEAYDLDTVTFSNNYFEYDNGGIYISTSSLINNPDCRFEDNELYNNYADGIYADYVDDAVFTGNIFHDNDDDGMHLYWSDSVRIYGDNEFTENSNNGLYLDTWCDNALVYENLFDDNDYGMYLYDSYNAEIYENDFTNNDGSAGLYIQDCDTVYLHDNDVLYNFYGIYVDPTTGLTLEENTVSENNNIGVFFDSVFDSTMEGNTISYNEFEGIYMSSSDSIDVIDNTIEYNGQAGGFSGIYCTNTHFAEINDNTVMENDGDGIYLDDCDFATIDPNDIYGNYGVGLYMDNADYATVEDNNIYENEDHGVYATDSVYGYFSGNTVYNNWGSGYQMDEDCDDSEFIGETIYGNGWDDNEYGFYGYDSNTMTLTDIELYNCYGGFEFEDVDDATFTNVNSYGHENDCFWLYGCNNFEMTNCHGWDSDNYGFYFGDGAANDGLLTDCSSHDHASGVYGMEIYDSSTVEVDNFMMYGMPDTWLYIEVGSTLDASVGDGLWMGLNDQFGGGWWYSSISPGGDDLDLYDGNFLIANDFMSMDDGDSATDAISGETAFLSLLSHGSCSAAKYYVDTGFPQDRDEILTDGTTFTPATSSCSSGVATFEVAGFASGYAVMAGGGDDDGAKSMSITACSGAKVGEECIIKVKSGGSLLSGAEVRVTTWQDGMLKVFNLGDTDGDGEVSFTPEYEGTHEIRATKSGYVTATSSFWVSGSGEVPAAAECTKDSDCASGYECVKGACELITEEEITEEEEESEPECLTDMDCDEGFACVDSQCLETAMGGEMGIVMDETTATEAIDAAQEAIDAAKAEGRDTAEAEALLEEAKAAFAMGSYEDAFQLAEEAENAAKNAPMPAAPPAPAEQPEEVQVGEGAEAPAPAPPQEEFPWLWVLLILVLGGIVVWYLFFRGQGGK